MKHLFLILLFVTGLQCSNKQKLAQSPFIRWIFELSNHPDVLVSGKLLSAPFTTKQITQDSTILNSKEFNVLGTVFINEAYINHEKNIFYIDYSYTGVCMKSTFSGIMVLELHNGKWQVQSTEVYEMS
jgi:hypothetical protein